MPAYKIASGDLKNTPLLQSIARRENHDVGGTGGASLEDVQRAC
jgi:N-acetylneuraminate synthase/sialic acid synthase